MKSLKKKSLKIEELTNKLENCKSSEIHPPNSNMENFFKSIQESHADELKMKEDFLSKSSSEIKQL